ncbi:MAG: ABC-type cobalt transport system, ATPase component [halophilic archaeon J07HB67]|nr:MAG: ABC-type cobalt transport system, ATPase component [halophilic archaeon J07HB67]
MLRADGAVFDYADRGSRLAPPDGGSSDVADTGRPALDGVSLSIPDGQFRLLAGPNGSGKSTLVRLFVGLETADTGRVSVDGHDPATDPVAVRTRVGVVFQNPRDQLVAATVAADVAFGPENLGLDRAEIDRRVETALATVGMDGRGEDVSSSSPAVSVPVSRSRGCWRWSRTTSCWTSRSSGWTPPPGRPSSNTSGRWPRRRRLSSSSPTTSVGCCRRQTTSPSSRTARLRCPRDPRKRATDSRSWVSPSPARDDTRREP